MNTAPMLARWHKLNRLRDALDTEIRALRNGLIMADVIPGPVAPSGRQPLPCAFTYTEREAKAAHALHAAGEDSEWVTGGERAYQRAKKRIERARRAA